MRAPARSTTGNSLAFAFDQSLPRPVVLRLIGGKHTAADRAMYYRTTWWAAKRAEALQAFGHSCALCGGTLGLQVHHKPRGYRHLFRERPVIDLTVLCARCHRRHHGK